MFLVYKIIKKFLFLKESLIVILRLNFKTFSKTFLFNKLLSKLTNRQNQAKLDYFNLYLDKIYKKREIMLVRKKNIL